VVVTHLITAILFNIWKNEKHSSSD